MTRLLDTKWIASIILCLLTLSCKEAAKSEATVKSDWETPEAPALALPVLNESNGTIDELPLGEPAAKTIDVTRNYIIDWSCEPKYFGESSERVIENQEEYCEWRTVKTTGDEKECKFTTSFDESREFHLNSREETPFNTIAAARSLVDACAQNATKMLKKGKGSAGALCGGLSDDCVSWRNSDPEICDKVRWAMKERYEQRIEFCVDQLTSKDSVKTEQPLIQFGLLNDLPENCKFSADDKTEVVCTIPKEDTCFSVAGQLRPGMRVITKALGSEAKLPPARECFKPK